MKSLTLKEIISVIDGTIVRGKGNMIIEHVVTKYLDLKHGSLLFDIKHDCARKKDILPPSLCCAIVTDTPDNYLQSDENATVIAVKNIKTALWAFIDYYRRLFNIPVIGVTGTCGKTTTKEMIRHILSGFYKVNATYKSLNAHAHHLDYLTAIDDSTQAAVYEMGLAYPNDILISSRFFKPHVGVITTIGVDHLKAFKTLDAYVKGKAEMLEGLCNRGTLILNADDINIAKIDLTKFIGTIHYFGSGDKADYQIENVRDTNNGIEFDLRCSGQEHHVELPQPGQFNAYNAAAAIAAVGAIGISAQAACDMLKSFKNVERHLQLKSGINGSVIIDDTWSTNPTSAAAAIRHLQQKAFADNKKSIAILGKMALLGSSSVDYHRQIGKLVAESGINYLVILGDEARDIGLGALEKEMAAECVLFCKNQKSAAEIVAGLLDENTVALVKTSMLRHYSGLLDAISYTR